MATQQQQAYTQWDLTRSASRVQDVLGSLPLDAQQFQLASVARMHQSSAGADAVAETVVSQTDQEVTSKYITMTDVMAQMNESTNTNLYLADSLETEIGRVQKLDGRAKNGIYKVRQQHQYYNYMESYYVFVTRIMIFTLIVSLLILTCVALWRMGRITPGMFWTIVLVILALYAIIMTISFQNAAFRRKNAWDKYYFKTSDEVRNAAAQSSGSCST
jgi:hypothetical protein